MHRLTRLARALVVGWLTVPAAALAQDSTGTIVVFVTHAGQAVRGASARAGAVTARTGSDGRARLELVAGEHMIVAARLGLRPDSLALTVRPGLDTTVTFALEEQAEHVERIVVTATRTERRIEDVPLRVEVLAREEIEEKMLMTPGDISMMLNETGGLRVQTTSPSLGAANVRMQGLRGRYTLLLADGLPLYGGQTGTLGLLQIPPMDLAQVEVIKGVASALYGAAALGGVVNLVSRRPPETPERELLLNQTTRGGSDAILWLSQELSERWGYTFLGGGHRQTAVDRDRDGWADVPAYERAVARPRLFWTGAGGRNAMLTVGATIEDRRGGTMRGATAPDGSPFLESLETERLDAGAIVRLPFARGVISARSSAMLQRHAHRFGAVRERDTHASAFVETSIAATAGAHTALAGVALAVDDFSSRDVARFDYRHVMPAAFAQWDFDASAWLAMSVSGRADVHSEYGASFNPRVSLLVRTPAGWTARLSGGTGVFAPTPFTEQTEAVGLAPLRSFAGLSSERAAGASLDVGGVVGALELNATVFASRLASPLIVRPVAASPSEIEMLNATAPTRTVGADLLARYRVGDVTATATYARVHSTEQAPERAGRRVVPLTPAHAAGVVAVWEQEGRQRIGLEAYHTGVQALDENPYRARSRPYWIFGAIAERRIGSVRIFVNFENVGDARLTRHQPLVRPNRGPGGRWTTDAWAPLDGHTVNGGVRIDFGSAERAH